MVATPVPPFQRRPVDTDITLSRMEYADIGDSTRIYWNERIYTQGIANDLWNKEKKKVGSKATP